MYDLILSGVKYTDAGIYAIRHAVALARCCDAKLHFIHTYESKLAAQAAESQERLAHEDAACGRYRREIEPLLNGVQAEFECLPDEPSMALCRRARELEASVIVLGCHSPGKKARLSRIGYTGMTALEKAPCPVLLVPLPA